MSVTRQDLFPHMSSLPPALDQLNVAVAVCVAKQPDTDRCHVSLQPTMNASVPLDFHGLLDGARVQRTSMSVQMEVDNLPACVRLARCVEQQVAAPAHATTPP